MIFSTRSSVEIEEGKFRIYYGCEQTDPITQEWQMVIWKNDKEVARYSNSTLLELSDGERPVDIVLAGMIKHFCRS